MTLAAEFCAFLRRFSGKREKDQVSIGSGWWQWTQQASARIHSTVRSYFPMSNLERWIGPAQVTSHPSHASPTRTAFRSRLPRTGAAFGRRAEVPRVRSWADYDGGARPHAVARRARATLPASPLAVPARTSRASAAVSSGSSRRAALRSTCHRDVPSVPTRWPSATLPRSTFESAHQNPRPNSQTQPVRITGRDWPVMPSSA